MKKIRLYKGQPEKTEADAGIPSLENCELRALGITMPTGNPNALKVNYQLPEDITGMSAAGITNMMAACSNQHAYILAQIAIQSIMLCAKSRVFERRKAAVMLQDASSNKYRAEAGCSVNPLLQKLEDEYDKVDGIVDLMKAIATGLHEKIAVLSREISRRQAEVGLTGKL